MLYLTLQDDPFPDYDYDEKILLECRGETGAPTQVTSWPFSKEQCGSRFGRNADKTGLSIAYSLHTTEISTPSHYPTTDALRHRAIFQRAKLERQLVRSVARKDADARTVSELIQFQDSLDRLGLLWASFDSLDKNQVCEFVRNLHWELPEAGDIVYLKHFPATRSYVVLRGTILLCNNVLDREEDEGTRILVPGDEFGVPLDIDMDADQPVSDFQECAKNVSVKYCHDSVRCGEGAPTPAEGARKDGRVELLVITRMDWAYSLQSSRRNFAGVIAKEVASREPDDLKDKARLAFDFPPKGRSENQQATARTFLVERVSFCKDLPSEQLSAMAANLELRGYTTPGRVIFRRGQECFGEVYIMFTGTADLVGRERSGDRLIIEGGLFGDEYFGAEAYGVQETRFRKATAISRTSPCELLVLPNRECHRLQAYVTIRNKKEAMVVFEKFFHSMPCETRSELSALATLRKVNMHSRLATEGDVVTDIFFVIRGECIARRRSSSNNSSKNVERGEEMRCGPGHIIGWWLLMPEPQASNPTPAPPSCSASKSVVVEEKSRRPGRAGKVWSHNVTVTTPAQVLSVPIKLLTVLSEGALYGLRDFISLAQEQVLEQDSTTMVSSAERDHFAEGDTAAKTSVEGFAVHPYFRSKRPRASGPIKRERSLYSLPPLPERFSSIPDTAKPSRQLCAMEGGQAQPSSLIPGRTADWNIRRFRTWRWRKNIAEEEESTVQREASLHRVRYYPMENNTRCSPRKRLDRFYPTPVWTSSLQQDISTFVEPCTMHAARGLAASKEQLSKFSLVTVASNRGVDGKRKGDDQDAPEGSAACSEKAVQKESYYVQTKMTRLASRAPAKLRGVFRPADGERTAVPASNVDDSLTESTTPAEERMADTSAPLRETRRPYALVQLSRRPALDPSDPSAALCLRILGSFEFEMEAKTRVLHLYHSVLPAKSSWQRCQGSRGSGYDCVLEDCSDVVFLLRKGFPSQLLSFNVATERVEKTLDRSEEVGKGFDASVPAVFRAKAQLFAIALVPYTEIIAEQWDQHRKTLRSGGECKSRSEHDFRPDEAVFTSALAPSTIEEYPMPNPELSMVDEVEDRRNSHSSGGREMAGEQDITRASPDNSGTHAISGDAATEQATPSSRGADVEDHTKSFKCSQKAVASRGDDNDGCVAGGSMVSSSEQEQESRTDWLVDTSEPTSSEDERNQWQSMQSGSGRSSEAEIKENESCSDNFFEEGTAVVPWLFSRMSLFKKVEGCYETEATAFREAIKILHEIEVVAASEHTLFVSRATEGRGEARPYHRQPSCRACVFPLYRWLSLGNGLISSLEAVIGEYSVSNDAEAARAGVNPCEVLAYHRARRMRANLYGLLEVKGQTKNRCRCGWGAADDEIGKMGGEGACITTRRAKRVSEEERGFGGSYAEKVQCRRSGVLEARKAVLTQGEKLLKAEMDVRRQLANFTSRAINIAVGARNRATAALDDWGKAEVETKPNTIDVNTTSELQKRVGGPIDSTWIDEVGMRFGTVDGGCESARYKLRAQMSIERKRAQFFEDIRMLPYNERKRGAKRLTVRRKGCNDQRTNASKADASSSRNVLRVDSVRAQTRLHGKPAVSFFNGVHGGNSVAGEKPPFDETYPSLKAIEIISPKGEVITKAEHANAHPAPSSTEKGKDVNISASSMTTYSSDPDTLGGLSNLDKADSSRREVDSSTVDLQAAKSRGLSTTHQNRSNAVGKDKGHRGRLRRYGSSNDALNNGDGVCNLEAELVLLDGVLRDPQMKAWVETALGHNGHNL